MIHIESAKYLDGYCIQLKFNTDEIGIVDLTELINRYPIAQQLKDKALFSQFYLDEWPSLAWPCGFDVSPETLYEMATGKTVSWLKQA
ncbi:DUF2442 domain-containing protein [uncultured Deefgea sp.]|uniref:DUF2442 domain-containing protein n=1 Tax=uncultured Deefgea sp. TaxID=1304914 RepID=UPI002591FA9A|nr:DUF2442 domain-containing protein [uncultured Deefgea sp.]